MSSFRVKLLLEPSLVFFYLILINLIREIGHEYILFLRLGFFNNLVVLTAIVTDSLKIFKVAVLRYGTYRCIEKGAAVLL